MRVSLSVRARIEIDSVRCYINVNERDLISMYMMYMYLLEASQAQAGIAHAVLNCIAQRHGCVYVYTHTCV